MKTLRSTNTPFTPYHDHNLVICIGCGLNIYIWHYYASVSSSSTDTIQEEVLSNCHAAYNIREKAELCSYFQ